MKKSIATIIFNSMQMTFSVVSDKEGFGCLEYSTKSVYSGVSRSFFVSPVEIEGAILDFLERYSAFSGKRVGHIDLVLPQHFFLLQPHIKSISVGDKVTEQNMRQAKNGHIDEADGYVVLEKLDGGFSVDGQGDFMASAAGKRCATLQHLSVMVGLKSSVYELFCNIAKNLHLTFRFVSPGQPIAECMHKMGSKRGLVLVINQLSSNLIYFENRLAVSAIELLFGSFQYVDAPVHALGVTHDEGIELLRHVNLGLAYNAPDYELSTTEGKKTFSVEEINNLIVSLIQKHARETNSAMKGMIGDNKMPLYVTGSSVAKMHGYCELMSQATGQKVSLLSPDFSYWNIPEEFLSYALFAQY